MSPIWVVPLFVLALGAVALVALLRGSAEAARQLASEISRFGELQASMARVASEAQQGRAALRRHRER